jgi:HSP20 family protein
VFHQTVNNFGVASRVHEHVRRERATNMANQNLDVTKQADQKTASLSVMPFDLIFMNPFSVMRRMTEEMDRAFQASNGANGDSALWAPAVEVSQTGSQYVVRAELPGLKPDEVQIEVSEDGLVLSGERTFERDLDKGGVHRTEIRYGRFYRVIPLPDGASVDQAKAKFENGVLEVTVPLAEETNKRRRIQVESSQVESSRTPLAETSQKAA